MKILLVDDELQVRQSLKFLINWEQYGYELFTAENGEVACSLMQQYKIDFLLLDITMPIMDGFEVLSWIESECYECKVLILTCHDEFEYAQKALQFKCYDYMLKNTISSENILQIINRVKSELLETRKKNKQVSLLQKAASDKIFMESQDYLLYWLTCEKDSSIPIESYLMKNQIFNPQKQKFILFLINILDYEKVLVRYVNNDITQFEFIFQGIIKELLQSSSYFYVKPEQNQYLIFIAYNKSLNMSDIISHFNELSMNIHDKLHSILQINTHLYYSMVFSNFSQSKFYYTQLKLLITQDLFEHSYSVVCIDDYIFDHSLEQKMLTQLFKDLRSSLHMRHYGFFELTIDEFVNKVCEDKIYITTNSFINCIHNALSLFFISTLGTDCLLSSPSEVLTLSTLKNEISHALLPYCTPELNENKKYIIKKTLLYIHQNYNQNIYLDTIAEHVNVNTSYLSRVFSQETGTSLTNYINNYKIERAKDLISNSNLKFYQIAEQTGFSSPIIFSTVFKKITGCTPGEFRNSCV